MDTEKNLNNQNIHYFVYIQFYLRRLIYNYTVLLEDFIFKT